MTQTDIRQDFHIDNLPTIKEELERKAFEQLESLAVRLEQGQISEAQFDAGVESVWACVGGLVGQSLTVTISEIKNYRAKNCASYCDSRVFTKDKNVLVSTRIVGEGRTTLWLKGETREKEFPHTEYFMPSRAAKQHQEELTDKLITEGWERRF